MPKQVQTTFAQQLQAQMRQQSVNQMSRSQWNQWVQQYPAGVQQPYPTSIPTNLAPNPNANVKIINPITNRPTSGTFLQPTQPYFLNQALFWLELDVLELGQYNKLQIQYNDPKTTEHMLYQDIQNLYQKFLSDFLPKVDSPTAIVPKDTGALRTAIKFSVQGAHGGVGGSTYTRTGNLHPFLVVLNTGKIPYAVWVNMMPEEWLRHPGNHQYNWSTRKFKPKQKAHALNDPNAKSNWFNLLIDDGLQIWDKLWKDYVSGVFRQRFDRTLTALGISEQLLANAIFDRKV